MSEEELTPRENFVVRMVVLAIVAFGVLAIWQLYLTYVHAQWEQGLVEYVIYYQLREQTPLVYMIVNAVIIVGGIFLIARAWWEQYGRENLSQSRRVVLEARHEQESEKDQGS